MQNISEHSGFARCRLFVRAAFARGRFEMEYTAETDGVRKKYANAGDYVMILRKRGDQWLISRYIWDDPTPRTVSP